METKAIIRIKEIFSLLGASLVGFGLYLGFDGYTYSITEVILVGLFIASTPFIWTKKLYSSIISKHHKWKQIEYKTFEKMGLSLSMLWLMLGILLWVSPNN